MNRLRQLGMATVALTLVSGVTFARCNSSSLTGPDQGPDPVRGPQVRGDLVSGGEVLEAVPLLPSLLSEDDPETASADPDFQTSTKTTFFTTETVHNPCRNEDPVLSGFIHSHEKLKMDDGTLKYRMRTWKDTRGTAATAVATHDDDRNPLTPPRTLTVRYINKQRTLDRFEVGPAGLPFESDQEDRIMLIRLSPEHGMKYGPHDDRSDDDDDSEFRAGPGDDLFVRARERVRVDQRGVSKQRSEFKTECK